MSREKVVSLVIAVSCILIAARRWMVRARYHQQIEIVAPEP